MREFHQGQEKTKQWHRIIYRYFKGQHFHMANGSYTEPGLRFDSKDEYKNDIATFQPISLSVKYGTTYEQILQNYRL